MKSFLLAIETSCDETAAAVFELRRDARSAGELLRSEVVASQITSHQPYGGVVPELASREHLKNLPLVVKDALLKSGVAIDSIKAVSATRGPGLKGCLLVGWEYAKGLAYARGIPLIAVNHLEAHLNSCFLMPNDQQPEFPCLALLVSGGHTSLATWELPNKISVVAQTRDDAAGEAFDKIAALMGYPYPGGPALAAAAAKPDANKHAYEFPIGMADDSSAFSFSGFKTAVARKIAELSTLDAKERIDVAASAQEAIVEALLVKVDSAVQKNKVKSLLLTGGVAANGRLREKLAHFAAAKQLKFCVPAAKWCTDNAAMVGAAGLAAYQRDYAMYEQWLSGQRADSCLGLDVSFEVSAAARWPLGEPLHGQR